MMRSPVFPIKSRKQNQPQLKQQKPGFFPVMEYPVDHIPFYHPEITYGEFCTIVKSKYALPLFQGKYFDEETKNECIKYISKLDTLTSEEKKKIGTETSIKISKQTSDLIASCKALSDLEFDKFDKFDEFLVQIQKIFTLVEFRFYYNKILIEKNSNDSAAIEPTILSEKIMKELNCLIVLFCMFIDSTKTGLKLQKSDKSSLLWQKIFAICETIRRSTVFLSIGVNDSFKSMDFLKILLYAFNKGWPDINFNNSFIYKQILMRKISGLMVEEAYHEKGGIYFMSAVADDKRLPSDSHNIKIYYDENKRGYYFRAKLEDKIEDVELPFFDALSKETFDQTIESYKASSNKWLTKTIFQYTAEKGYTDTYQCIERDWLFRLYTYYHLDHINWLPLCDYRENSSLVHGHLHQSFKYIMAMRETLFDKISDMDSLQIKTIDENINQIDKHLLLSENFLGDFLEIDKSRRHGQLVKISAEVKKRLNSLKQDFELKKKEMISCFSRNSVSVCNKKQIEKTIEKPVEKPVVCGLLSNPLSPAARPEYHDEHKRAECIPLSEQVADKNKKREKYHASAFFSAPVMPSAPASVADKSASYKLLLPGFKDVIEVILDHESCRQAMGDEPFEKLLPMLNDILLRGYLCQSFRQISRQEMQGMPFEDNDKGHWFKLAPYGDALRVFGRIQDGKLCFNHPVYKNVHEKIARMRK